MPSGHRPGPTEAAAETGAPLKKLYIILKIEIPLPRQFGALLPKSACVGGVRGWAAFPALYSQRGASPPLYPPQGEGSPCNPSTRRGSAPLAPPKGSLVLDLLQKGFPKNNTRLRLPLPARLCRATSPTGGGKSRLPLWGRWSPVATVHRRSPLPLWSVLDAPHWGAGPEPAGETQSRHSRD